MEKLQGAGNQGQFVHENQDMASKQGFDNVSKLWYDKTMSYDEGSSNWNRIVVIVRISRSH